MKRNILLGITVLAILLTATLSGCGSPDSSGSGNNKEPEPFTLGEYTYKLDKIARAPDEDEDSKKGYTVSLLIEGNEAPIIITNGVTKAGVEMALKDGENEINYSVASFSVLPEEDKIEEYGAKAVFGFKIPDGNSFPREAVVTDGTGSSETVTLDLSGMKVEDSEEGTE